MVNLERNLPHLVPNLIFHLSQISKHDMRMKNYLDYLHQFELIDFPCVGIHCRNILFSDPLLLHKGWTRDQNQK